MRRCYLAGTSPIDAILFIGVALAAFGVSFCARAQGVRVPAEQRDLSDILSKYNELHERAPNGIQRDRIDTQFAQEFCAKIPTGDVSGWIGKVWSIDDHTPDKGIRLELSVDNHLRSGPLGVGLFLVNYEASSKNTQPHSPTVISVGSPLYGSAANYREGDVLRFDGTFIPFVSSQACFDSIRYSSRFSLFRFTAIQKLAPDVQIR